MNASTTAGRSVRRTSRQCYEQAALLGLVAAALLCLGGAIGSEAAGGMGALLVAIAAVVAWEARKRWHLARRYKVGAVAEERVGSRLWALEERGWLVEHDVEKAGGGNVDHLVHSPAVTFLIDTKASRWSGRDVEQAHRHARWAAARYGAERELVSVICIQRSEQRARSVDGVYVVGASRLLDLLCDRG